MFEIDDDYCATVSAAYFAEEQEMRLGIHPSQVLERIKDTLSEMEITYEKITFLDWNVHGPRVKVFIDNSDFGIFNYSTNQFEYRMK